MKQLIRGTNGTHDGTPGRGHRWRQLLSPGQVYGRRGLIAAAMALAAVLCMPTRET